MEVERFRIRCSGLNNPKQKQRSDLITMYGFLCLIEFMFNQKRFIYKADSTFHYEPFE